MQVKLPALAFREDAFRANDPEQINVVRDTGGSTRGYPDFKSEATVQITSRAKDKHTAERDAEQIFNVMRDSYGIDLPVYNTESTPLHVEKISAIQRPYFLEIDPQGSFRYVTNYIIVFFENFRTVP